MRQVGEFEAVGSAVFSRGARVVVQTSRGTEVGEVLCSANEHTRDALGAEEGGQLLRALSPDDEQMLSHLARCEAQAFDLCAALIDKHGLPMCLVDAEWLLGGERILFHFITHPPDQRVDFRLLVRDLARELHSRIELRQIGPRDEAKALADYGDCGRPVCCNSFMIHMPPVSMRMAKIQRASLDPFKISGRCGRLKCCLRYEQEVYDDILATLPPVGADVLTAEGPARVLTQEILARRLLVEHRDGRRVFVEAAAVSRDDEAQPS